MDLRDCLYIQIHQRYVGDDLPVLPEKPQEGKEGETILTRISRAKGI